MFPKWIPKWLRAARRGPLLQEVRDVEIVVVVEHDRASRRLRALRRLAATGIRPAPEILAAAVVLVSRRLLHATCTGSSVAVRSTVSSARPRAPLRRRPAARGSARGAAHATGARGAPPSKPGRDDGDPHLVAERVVDDRAEDDVGVRVRGVGDQLRGLVDLEQAEVASRRRWTSARRAHRRWTPRAAGWRSPSRRRRPRGRRRGPSRCP